MRRASDRTGTGCDADRLRRSARGEDGFTLVELVVVVVIIGILVAIGVPLYLNYRKGASDKAAQSDARGAISTLEKYYADNHNSYPASAVTQVSSFSLVTPGGVITDLMVNLSDKTTMTLYVAGPTATSYRICTWNTNGSKQYLYDSALGSSVRDVTITDDSTCAT
jgi:type IV pilus assembly protein PilA